MSIVTLLTAIAGIVGTVLAWMLNPKRRLYAELDGIYNELEALYVKRDDALQANDSDTLTVVTDAIVRLCARKAVLLQRL